MGRLATAIDIVNTLDDDAVVDMLVNRFNLKAYDWKKALIAHHWVCSCKYGQYYMNDLRDLLISLITKRI